jgi:hypothetical protein
MALDRRYALFCGAFLVACMVAVVLVLLIHLWGGQFWTIWIWLWT